jgi:hypothetical protein
VTAQQWLSGTAGAAALLAILAGIAESRRNRRRNLDRTGWVPWRGIQAAAFFAVLLFAVLAVKASP